MSRTTPVGIDLGTTNSVVAILDNGRPVVVPNAEGSLLTPSVVGFAPSGEVLVGALAERLGVTHPDRVVRSVKRQMGSDWTFAVDGREWRAQEISARILHKLRRDTEAAVGEPIAQAVITVPAYFDDARRQATLDAARISGLDVLRIVNEPTAASLAYGLDTDGAATVAVFDLGGGTCDVSILAIGAGVFEVRSTCGDVALGGDDWDERIVTWLLDGAPSSATAQMRDDPGLRTRLRAAAEAAKIDLSVHESSTVRLPPGDGPAGTELTRTTRELTRTTLEALTADLTASCRSLFQRAVADAGLSMAALDHVVLVGGATRMPAIRRLVHELAGTEPHARIDPERVVAIGAALQAGVLLGERTGLLLVDVTPLSLGLATRGGVMTPIIARNTTIPVRHSQIFTTAQDGQTSVEVQVLQGERPMAAQNRSLGTFELAGIAPMPRGEAQVEVTFAIDADGIVRIAAHDLLTGQKQDLTVTGNSSLAPEVVQQMVDEAERAAGDDRRRRDETGARNEAELACYHAERLIIEHPESLGTFGGVLHELVENLTIALTTGDVELIRKTHRSLLAVLRAAAEQDGGATGPPSN